MNCKHDNESFEDVDEELVRRRLQRKEIERYQNDMKLYCDHEPSNSSLDESFLSHYLSDNLEISGLRSFSGSASSSATHFQFPVANRRRRNSVIASSAETGNVFINSDDVEIEIAYSFEEIERAVRQQTEAEEQIASVEDAQENEAREREVTELLENDDNLDYLITDDDESSEVSFLSCVNSLRSAVSSPLSATSDLCNPNCLPVTSVSNEDDRDSENGSSSDLDRCNFCSSSISSDRSVPDPCNPSCVLRTWISNEDERESENGSSSDLDHCNFCSSSTSSDRSVPDPCNPFGVLRAWISNEDERESENGSSSDLDHCNFCSSCTSSDRSMPDPCNPSCVFGAWISNEDERGSENGLSSDLDHSSFHSIGNSSDHQITEGNQNISFDLPRSSCNITGSSLRGEELEDDEEHEGDEGYEDDEEHEDDEGDALCLVLRLFFRLVAVFLDLFVSVSLRSAAPLNERNSEFLQDDQNEGAGEDNGNDNYEGDDEEHEGDEHEDDEEHENGEDDEADDYSNEEIANVFQYSFESNPYSDDEDSLAYGLSSYELLLLPTRTFKSSTKQQLIPDQVEGADWVECQVCLDKFTDGELIRTLPCCHQFHAKCIDVWLGKSVICPVCRLGITEELFGA